MYKRLKSILDATNGVVYEEVFSVYEETAGTVINKYIYIYISIYYV